MALNATEQYMLELINRGRLDPLAEAARYGIDLNDGLAAGTIGSGALQVLAPDSALETAAERHSQWMLDTDIFSHTGVNGSQPRDRMAAAGYVFTGATVTRENLNVQGSTGSLNLAATISVQHEALFRSSGHRANTFTAAVREIGIAQVAGSFSYGGNTFNAAMVTQDFALSGSETFLTGVAYRDSDGNDFYGIGEGLGGVVFGLAGQSATTAAAGGYGIGAPPSATAAVTVQYGGSQIAALSVDLADGNGKLDLVQDTTGGWSLALSASAILLSGVADARLLGVGALNLTGHAGANLLTGNSGANRLAGLDGNDHLQGGAGRDTLEGDAGNDLLQGGNGDDRLEDGRGLDTLTGGTGADLFVLGSDNQTDLITDFTLGSDTIDLSLWAGLLAVTQLAITATATGMTIGFGSELLVVQSADGSSITPAALGGTLVNLSSQLPPPPTPDPEPEPDPGVMPLPGPDPEPRPGDITGTAADEPRSGTAAADRIFGLAGADTLTGDSGNDALYGGADNDVLYGGAGADWMVGGSGADQMEGGTGNDSYVVDDAGDVIAGETGFTQGGGIDLVEVWINQFVAPTNIELVRLQGTANLTVTANDAPGTLIGNSGHNMLYGRGGHDQINGNDGNDTLVGGMGADTLVGGAGADVFLFTAVADSRVGPLERDFINGFVHGEDRINLRAIDGDPFAAGHQGFRFIGTAGFSGNGAASAGEMRATTWGGGNFNLVEIDRTGDGVAEMQIFVNLTAFMTADDFIF